MATKAFKLLHCADEANTVIDFTVRGGGKVVVETTPTNSTLVSKVLTAAQARTVWAAWVRKGAGRVIGDRCYVVLAGGRLSYSIIESWYDGAVSPADYCPLGFVTDAVASSVDEYCSHDESVTRYIFSPAA